jgi:hypothetical protein
MPSQLPFQRAAALDIQRLVDRLVRHPHLRIVGIVLPQPGSDLLWTVVVVQPSLHLTPQRQIPRQLRRLGPPSLLIGVGLRRRGPIRRSITMPVVGVAGRPPQLTADRGRISLQEPCDLADTHSCGLEQRDLLPLGETPRPCSLARPHRWQHTATLAEPLFALGVRHADTCRCFLDQ